ncbi:MAG: hypothetical protein KJ000_05465 [Pirellulaceae bacterium]|nr:hypothetical protein [Pirellulaceae bacterium]
MFLLFLLSILHPAAGQDVAPKPEQAAAEAADSEAKPAPKSEQPAAGEPETPAVKEPAAKKPAAEPPVPVKRFYEQEQYDLITLDAANDNAVLKVMPLQLPDRKLPEPAKRVGKLKVRLFDRREEEYEVMWRNVVQVELFEELVLREAEQIVQRAAQLGRGGKPAESQKQFDEAYDFFRWLLTYHGELTGLEKGIQDYLYLNAGTLFLIGAQYETDASAASDEAQAARLKKQAFDKFAQALSILEELVGQNSQYAYGSATNTAVAALERVADRLIGWYAKDFNFVAVRRLIVRLQKDYRNKLAVARTWQDRLIAGATAKRDAAKEHLQAKRFAEAHEASREMLKIWPQVEGGRDLVLELSRVYPLIVVSVAQPARTLDPVSLHDSAARRGGHLVYPTLSEFQERGPEGGRYASPFGSMQQSDDRMQLIFDLRSDNSEMPFTGYDLSRNLLAMTDPLGPRYDPAWSSLMRSLQVEDVMRVRVSLRRPHVLPQAILRTRFHLGDQMASRYSMERLSDTETRYAPSAGMTDAGQPRPVIVERFHDQPRAALEDLRKGKIDMIDRLLPADAQRIQQEPGIQVGMYGFPTLFVLTANTKHPYLANRTFRRALVYGINREVILNQGLLNGHQVEGSRVISAPLPAGIGANDPSAYAYDPQVAPYPYDPVMAAILVGLASQQLGAIADQREEPMPELGELVLAHPFGELHRFIARQIQMQWQVFDVACKLRELPPGETQPTDGQFDLLLMEIRMLEPLVDLPRLLGERGVVPSDDPYVNHSLRRLYEAENWKVARGNLHELHRMLHNDATLIPLWQMMEYFAYHDGLQGIRQRPVFFYQDVERWRVVPPVQAD